MTRPETVEDQVNPSLLDTSQPNLVSAVMDDRLRDAAEARLAADVSPQPEAPYRFRRFLNKAAAPSRPRIQPAAPAPQGN